MLYDVRHCTTFEYDESVSIAHHMLHLTPRSFEKQQCFNFSLSLDPVPSLRTERTDYFGNHVHFLTMQEEHRRLVVDSRSRVEVNEFAPRDVASSTQWEEVVGKNLSSSETLSAQEFAFRSPYIDTSPELREYAMQSFTPQRPVLEGALDLTSRIFRDFEYKGGVSDVSTPVGDVLRMRQGVCQDFAHLQIACMRSLGLSARYVSGYLLTHPPPGEQRLIGADASHAWVSIWDGLDWVDFDPTNDLMPTTEHITVGWGRDYGDVSPTTGYIVGGGEHEVTVAVDVSLVAA